MKTTTMYCRREPRHDSGTFFNAFYPNTGCVLMHGKELPILQVEVTEDTTTTKKDTYWGWWDNEQQKYIHVYYHRIRLEMCFPYGLDIFEKEGEGKATPVTITVLDENAA